MQSHKDPRTGPIFTYAKKSIQIYVILIYLHKISDCISFLEISFILFTLVSSSESENEAKSKRHFVFINH